MLSMFPSSKSRRVTIAEVNRDIKSTFETVFAENYQQIRQQLIEGGIPEQKVDQKVSKIKLQLEQEMIVRARELLRESILEVLEDEQKALAVTNAPNA